MRIQERGWDDLNPTEQRFLALLCRPYLRADHSVEEPYPALARALGTSPGYVKQVAKSLADKLRPAERGRRGLTRHALDRWRPQLVRLLEARTEIELPVPSTAFFGRRAELEQIDTLLARGGLITLTGIGGIGKTRLACEYVRNRTLPAGPVWFVPVETETGDIGEAVASAVGVRTGAEDRPGLVARWMSERDGILLLDGCERRAESVAPFLTALLAGKPKARILATSREPLDVHGERVLAVPPLDVPDHAAPVRSITASSAFALFADRAAGATGEFAPDAEEIRDAAKICASLGGVPMAVEVAASHLGMLSLPDLAEHVAALATRRGTVRQALEWSADRLEDTERAVLTRLGLFESDVSLSAAIDVCADGGPVDVEDVPAAMATLVSRSLVMAVPGQRSRFLLLEPVRQFAKSLLDDDPQSDVHTERFISWAAKYSTAAIREGGTRSRTGIGMVEDDYPNLRRALDIAITNGRWSQAVDTAWACSGFWQMKGRQTEGLDTLEKLLDNLDQLSDEDSYRVFEMAGDLYTNTNQPETAHDYHARAIEVAQSLGDEHQTAKSLIGLGLAKWWMGSPDEADGFWREALVIYDRLDDDEGRAVALGNLANVALATGRLEDAEAQADSALRIQRRLGDARGMATALLILGNVALVQGNYGASIDRYEEALRAEEEVDDLERRADILSNLGSAALFAGNHGLAGSSLNRCLELRRRTANRWGEAAVRVNLAALALAIGDPQEALRQSADALSIFRVLGSVSGLAECLEGAAGALVALGYHSHAAVLYGAAKPLRESHQSPETPQEREHREADMARIEAESGANTTRQAFDRGASMEWEQILAHSMHLIGGITGKRDR